MQLTAGGTYYIGVRGYATTNYRLEAVAGPVTAVGASTVINSGDMVLGSVESQQWAFYRIALGASDLRLVVDLEGLSDDADLFVRKGQVPSGDRRFGANSECFSDKGGVRAENCVVDNNGSNTWYVGVYGYAKSDYTLRVLSSVNRLALTKPRRPTKGESSLKDGPGTSQSGVVQGGSGSMGFVGLFVLMLLRLRSGGRRTA